MNEEYIDVIYENGVFKPLKKDKPSKRNKDKDENS